MKPAAAKQTTTPPKPKQQEPFDGWVVALQLLDTGLRVAIPILVLSFVGSKLDNHFQTKPLYTLIGFFLSLAISIVLVYKQIKSAYPDFFDSVTRKKRK